MPNFRKKPVVIEAEQFIEESGRRLPFVIGKKRGPMRLNGGRWFVDTLEGSMRVIGGDWIIKGVRGEFYPIKNSIFRETYEEVPDA